MTAVAEETAESSLLFSARSALLPDRPRDGATVRLTAIKHILSVADPSLSTSGRAAGGGSDADAAGKCAEGTARSNGKVARNKQDGGKAA